MKNHRMALFLALTALSGFTALGHQLVWTRRLADLMGVGGEAATRVFGAFFLGLALGAWLADKVSPHLRRPWTWIAGAELAVMVTVVPLLFLPGWIAPLWQAVGPEGLVGPAGTWVRTLGSLALLLPPAMAMGFFLPLALPSLLATRGRIGREGMIAYGINTLGGVAGLGVVLLVFLPAWGVNGTLLALIGLNAVTAAGAFAFGRLPDLPALPKIPFNPPPAPTSPPPASRPALPLAVAAGSGFCVLAAEVAGFHLIQLAAPLSYQAAGAMLAAVLLALGAAALLYPRFERLAGGAEAALTRALQAATWSVLATPVLFYLIMVRAQVSLFTADTPAGFTFAAVALAFGVLGPAFFAAGLVFPAACSLEEPRSGRRGHGLGRLLAVNGVAAFLGAELAYHVALPLLGLTGTLAAIGILYAAALPWALPKTASRWRTVNAVALLGFAFLILPSLARLPTLNPHLPFKVLEQTAGREGAFAVIEGPGLGRAILVQNQYLLGSSGNHTEQRRLGALPLLLHPDPARVAYLGLATGITASAALDSRAVQTAVAVELSPVITRLAHTWFSEANRGVTTSPKFTVVVEDARIHLAAHTQAFDVVIGDLFLPWGPGEARLYTVDHFQAVRHALRPGGLFCQWLPLHQLTADHLAIILASFHTVFPEVEIFTRAFGGNTPLLALVGWQDGTSQLDWPTITRRIQTEHTPLRDPLLGHLSGLALLHRGQPDPHFFAHARPDRLNHLRLEILAGRDQIARRHGPPYLTGQTWLTTAQHLFPHPPSPPPAASPDASAFQHLLALLHTAEAQGRTSLDPAQRTALRQAAAQALPPDYLDALHLDWSAWSAPPLR